jgi:hypothetical protein
MSTEEKLIEKIDRLEWVVVKLEARRMDHRTWLAILFPLFGTLILSVFATQYQVNLQVVALREQLLAQEKTIINLAETFRRELEKLEKKNSGK